MGNEPVQRFVHAFQAQKRIRNVLGKSMRPMDTPTEIRGHQFVKQKDKLRGVIVPPRLLNEPLYADKDHL